MSQVTRVHLRHLLLAADTVDRLAQDLFPNGPASDDRIANSALLYTFINTHRQPMQAIGSRAGSIEHKLSAFLQSMRLESADSLVMDQRCPQAVSFTTDMGTELAIGSYLLPDHRTLLPTWLREDVADVLEDDGGAVPVWIVTTTCKWDQPLPTCPRRCWFAAHAFKRPERCARGAATLGSVCATVERGHPIC